MAKTNNQHAARAMKLLDKAGYYRDKCEQYISNVMGRSQSAKFAGGYRRDLFKVFDVMAFRPDLVGMTGVQVTTRKAITSHLSKYRTEEFKDGVPIREVLCGYLAARNRFLVVGYEKEGRFWVPTIVDVKPELLEPRVPWKGFVIEGLS